MTQNLNTDNATDNATGGAAPVPLLPPPSSPPRVSRTHTSPTIIQMLKTLSLTSILKKNKQIEAKNDARSIKTLNHTLDPTTHPDPGSEAASMLTIEDDNMKRLRLPSFITTVRDHIYSSLANFLADEELKEKEDKIKRKADDKPTTEELRISKRRCMDGSLLVQKTIGVPVPVEFTQSLFDTELCVPVPLPFFLNKNLRILTDEAATLPTVKSNPLPGETKGIYILDVDKLSDRFGKELSITCSQWTEAALNMYHFQQARDKSGKDGDHALWFNFHFNFFNEQRKRDELYEAWKSTELEFRLDHRSRKIAFDPADYEYAFKTSEESHKLRKEFQELIGSGQAKSLTGNRDGGGYSNTNKNNVKTPPRFRNNQSFPSGSGRSPPSSSSCCLICAEKGHNVFQHADSTTQVKFSDGKTTWAKCTSRGLITPDNRNLCINWNLRGERTGSCVHGRDERVHQCSFCGSKNHHAFSWTCRTQPT